MSTQDYTSIARTPLSELRRLPIDQLAALLEHLAAPTRAALERRIFQAQ